MSLLDPLRAAREALEPERTIAALDRALAAWRAPGSPWAARLAREQLTYSPEVIERGLSLALEPWTAAKLRELRAQELREPCLVPEVTAVWLAGSIPTAGFAALLLPLLAGSAVYAKPASADPASPRLFSQALGEADEAVGAALQIGSDDAALDEADAVVAYGSDETITRLHTRVGSQRVFVGYGHKLSLVCVGPGADPQEAALGIALDAALWDGRGCLSPAWVLVQGTDLAERLAESLAAALARLAKELPRAAPSAAEELSLRELRARAAIRAGTHLLMSRDSTAWTVVLEAPEAQQAPGTLRALPVVPVADLAALERWCRRLPPHLSSVAHTGWQDQEAEFVRVVERAGASRLCPPGRLQLPPIDWRHDGMDPIRPLLRGAE